MANLLIEIVVTLDKRAALFYRVLPVKVSDQTLQDRRVLCCVGIAYSILESAEEGRIVLVMLCHGRLFHGRLIITVAFTQGEFYVYRVIAFRPVGPEPSILTSILSRLSEERDIRDVGSQARTQVSCETLPYACDIGVGFGEEFLPWYEQG